MQLDSGRTLSHYRLIERIGEGGMGVVWKAEDTILNRTVAIKVLPADVARDEKRREMFLAEARLASSMSDAHIVQVHELGREGDLDFIVMEYVQGQPLSRILHGRPLPADKVAALGLQVAQSFSRAHRKGLLHRDLKPANIMVTPEGDVKVVDFGLAALLERSAEAIEDKPTRTAAPDPARADSGHEVAGTLDYMSPEQLSGETLDTRSDIYSFGVVLYEMATGQRPFSGATRSDLAREILKGRPTPAHDLVSKLPLELDRIIQKAIAPRAGERYQTMEDLAVDLKRLGRDLESGSSPSYEDLKSSVAATRPRRVGRWLLVGAAAVIVAAVCAWALLAWFTPQGDPHTVLVLPFDMRGQAEGGDYVGRAFAEAIAVSLAQAKELNVLPVPGGKELGTDAFDRARAARVMGAGRLLTGSLSREGTVLSTSLTLMDSSRNRILWGASKNATEQDLPRLAASLAQDIVAELSSGAVRLYDYPPNLSGGPEMAASQELSETLGPIRAGTPWKAGPAVERLLESFPEESAAHVLRVYVLFQVWQVDMSAIHRERFEQSLAALDRVDPKNPYTGFYRAFIPAKEPEVLRERIRRVTTALERADLSAAARAWMLRNRASLEGEAGDQAAALKDMEEAVGLDPVSFVTHDHYSELLQKSGRFEEALQHAQRCVTLAPSYPDGHADLAAALVSVGRGEEAVAEYSIACQLNPSQSMLGNYAVALQKTGHAAEALARAREAEGKPGTIDGTYALASYHALTKSRAMALRFLRRSLDLGLADLRLAVAPEFASLHGDSEFERVVAEVKKRVGRP